MPHIDILAVRNEEHVPDIEEPDVGAVCSPGHMNV